MKFLFCSYSLRPQSCSFFFLVGTEKLSSTNNTSKFHFSFFGTLSDMLAAALKKRKKENKNTENKNKKQYTVPSAQAITGTTNIFFRHDIFYSFDNFLSFRGVGSERIASIKHLKERYCRNWRTSWRVLEIRGLVEHFIVGKVFISININKYK